MYTENPASSGADFTGAVIEPGIRSEDGTTVQGKTAGQPRIASDARTLPTATNFNFSLNPIGSWSILYLLYHLFLSAYRLVPIPACR